MNRTILVINDDPVALRLTQSVLRGEDYEVHAFESAVEALSALHGELRPALIVADLHMPGIDGWKLCRLLRGPDFRAMNEVPILVVSATFTGVDVEAVTTDIGANAFLPAPFHPDTLLTYVRELLEGAFPVRRLRALVVDDDADVARSVRAIFEKHGYEVDLAGSVAEARDLRRLGAYDVFLLDYHLPDGDGGQLMGELRRPDDAAVAIMMTGDDNPDLPVRLLEAGADGYVRKPFDVRYLQDLTEKARRERSLLRVEALLERRTGELKESDARMRALFKAIPDWITVVNWDGTIVKANDAAHRAWGGGGLVGQRIERFLHPIDGTDLAAPIGEAWAHGSTHFDLHARVDRNEVHLSIAAEVTELEGDPVLLLVARDQTERRNAEEARRRLESQVQHTQRMESLGVLAGGIAHDFNNLLVGILGNASLAMMDVREGQAAESLRQIELAARRAAELTGQVLTFAGRAQPTAESLDLGDMIREMSGLLEPAISRSARLEYALPTTAPRILGDPAQLRQVVMNLIMNASDALQGESGTISIVAASRTVGADFDASGWLGDTPAPGEWLEFSVSDDGCGMDASTRARIFEPFFTTKFTGRGLGLAATLGIIHAHGGLLRVDSEVGRGTTISILLPADTARRPDHDDASEHATGSSTAAPVDGASARDAASPLSGPSIRVLVVDDEPAVLRLATMVLERQGMEVGTAVDGATALEVHESAEDPFDVVLVDMTMPGMSGVQLARRIRERGDDVPVILSSGYDRGAIERELEEIGGTWSVLAKPYRPADLVREIDEVLRRVGTAGV